MRDGKEPLQRFRVPWPDTTLVARLDKPVDGAGCAPLAPARCSTAMLPRPRQLVFHDQLSVWLQRGAIHVRLLREILGKATKTRRWQIGVARHPAVMLSALASSAHRIQRCGAPVPKNHSQIELPRFPKD